MIRVYIHDINSQDQEYMQPTINNEGGIDCSHK